ncbi:cell surface protein SprA [Dysgonomonas alginatilytica]|uniref:Cell surface protein SprA n=2 Tax=Dysgonomonas alginatilytica TaxID=1605892 RepID=A0A2V3PMY0_9BACT|nr:cell surface protein SprA [Dysgonomonas alginatilytica]
MDTTIPEISSDIALPEDTGAIYPVRKTQITNYEDLIQKTPVDLRDPSNIKTEVEFDVRNNIYLFRTKMDEGEWVTPFTLNPQQYMDYSLKESMTQYFKVKNSEAFDQKDKKEEFSLKDIKVNLGSLERVFGPGGVQLKTQGYTEVSAGIKHTSTENPTLALKNRSRTMFDFQQKIQMNVDASVGDKVNFGLNYDTEATFDFDSKRIKLAYEGDEDEIVKYLGAGNVALNTTNSLIGGGASLFGIRADLQFGKLRINTVISQQESETQTVGSKGGVQTKPFEFTADKYDENQHFFLTEYFRDHFDEGMSKLPFVKSPILITNIEVWVTNKRGNFDKARNVVAFADLAEHDSINNPRWIAGSIKVPDNRSNNLYSTIRSEYAEARDISNVTSVLTGRAGLVSGQDYEKLESARPLDASEYTLNTQLGFISLKSALADDEVLAVAFDYIMNGQNYRVGEFAVEIRSKVEAGDSKSGALFLKLVKPVALSPHSFSWDLMMKNVYRLGDRQIQKDKFRLNITYLSDTLGTYINFIPEGAIRNKLLLRVMNLDRLDAQENQHPDGIFDFLDGFTIYPENGRIIFPVVEPFGSHLRKQIANDAIADKFVYQQLYDSTRFVAEQIADRNKFKISGSYRASSSNSVINLNAMNVARGSVVVTANGVPLIENADYTVDYAAGEVTILNQSLIDAGTPINVTLENQALFSMQRKTLLGLNLSYDFSKNFTVGGTIMHMYERPLTAKVGIGEEAIKNTLWGLNTAYRTQSQWLTNLVDKLPFVTATAPSQIVFNAEFAHMIGGHYQNQYLHGYSYLDDFEAAKSTISLNNPYAWKLSSTPSLFKESTLSDNIEYGNNRAHLAWYTIDNLFTRRNSSLRPSYLIDDSLSNHFVREIQQSEIFPGRDMLANEPPLLSTLNLTYYPEERGMYNLDAVNISPEGRLLNPQTRWAGITRKIENRDFESTNIEYIQFWLMDPFVYNDRDPVKNEGGDLYFNLGDVSEDVLKDGRKFYENGLPLDDDTTAYAKTVWGKVPTRQSTVYAFDISQGAGAIQKQDVGLNGLSKAEEAQFGTYVNYSNTFRSNILPETEARMQQDPFSPLNDLSGDKYHHYRGADYDRQQTGIIDRYKYFNGTEGNSSAGDSDSQGFSTAASANPDVEDLDQDNTMNETERYFQYKVSLRPEDMRIGKDNYISDIQNVSVRLRNGDTTRINWYQFQIPIRDFKDTKGNIKDFTSIRFMRMFLTDFKQTTHLRFGTLDLVRGEWRVYTQTLQDGINQGEGSLNIAAVNIEENSEKQPVNYVIPPGVTRILDPSQPQVRQENEQALSLQVLKLQPEDARAVFKNTNYDLRRYKRLQMFTHAEELKDGEKIGQGEITVFLRLGSDFKSNYYEYEIPLSITPAGRYNSRNDADRATVWPTDNMFDFPLELLKNIKLQRNKEKRQAGSKVSFTELYSSYDPDKKSNKISVIGNPSLSEINVMMIGIRNNSTKVQSGEVWVNELRLTDYDDENGWAAQGNLSVALSDLGTVSFSGRKETSGFGSIDQNLIERRLDDFYSYDISANVDLGRFIPEKAKVSIPLYYSYSNQTITPKFDPLDQDVTLKEALSIVDTRAEKDSIKSLAQDRTSTKNLSLTNMKVNIQSKTPMPYDPANFTFGYAYSQTEVKNPTTVYDLTKNYKASMNYTYSPAVKTWAPFKDIKSKAPLAKYPKSLGFNYLPSNISFNSYMTRFYTETLVRDLDGYSLGSGSTNDNLFLTWSQNFYWDRDFSMNWDPLRNLKISVQTGTRAEIEEPYLQVNKKLNRDDYETWRDDVLRSIRNLGDPLSYRQAARVTYVLPFNNIPFLDWISSSANYDSRYTWDRGAVIDSITEVGNTITNSMTLNISNRIDLTTLYNKSPFLKKVNDKFEMSRRPQNQQRERRATAESRKKRFEKEIRLNLDSATLVKHGLGIKNIMLTARRDGKLFKIKYKRIDENTIRIMTKDTSEIKINIVQKGESDETTLYKVAQYAARGLMSVRSVSVNYSTREETAIGGFRPGIGDVFGQKQTDFGMVPGVGFAFGLDGGEDYVNRSLRNDWLVLNEMSISPAVYNSIKKLDLEAQVEPLKGLKIRLNALHEKNDRTTFQYDSKANVQKIYGGSFAMTTIALGSSFESSNVGNNYKSAAFDKFLKNRDVIVERFGKKYAGVHYPDVGFIADANLGTELFNPKNGAINPNSADVLIPAFLAAYTGKSADNIALTAFPTLFSMLPNWRINYDGLTTLPWFRDRFKKFILSHAYTAQYSVGSYTSFLTWIDAGNNMGFIKSLDDVAMPLPTSAYDISSVNLIEQFNPLLGAEGTLSNNLTMNVRYNYSRMLNLSITSFQLVETVQKDLVLGGGYRINEFNRLIGLPLKKDREFNNDLNVTADISRRTSQSLIRRIDEGFTEATSGNTILTLKLSAEYTLSRALLLRAFFDRIVNSPLISSASYPTANTNFGVSIRFTLTE